MNNKILYSNVLLDSNVSNMLEYFTVIETYLYACNLRCIINLQFFKYFIK